ncbi:MAG: YifB family Mg chelatase-like AAA ATPase [Armatimonadetes bacterium]|nr:YifB family Mg chelatase-like AAA ATPase [Armatimonadota bacterium]
MLAHVDSLAVLGVDAYLVRVEVDVSPGLISFSVVGLPDAAVRESGERVRAAIRNSGFAMPSRRITVNLAPADTKKQGPIFDLPIALGVLLGDGQLASPATSFAACGELGLNGEVRPITGVLPMALGAREAGKTAFLVPKANAAEAAVVEGLQIFPVESLADAVDWIQNGNRAPQEAHFSPDALENVHGDIDWADVKGQEAVKRALEVAAAGGHNILLVGAPGSGKTLLSRRLPTILPPLLLEEALEVTKLYSVAGLLPSGQSLVSSRPFRSPHHTVSHAGLVGGGSFPRPGEISLAHHGVLFLDELPEFHRDVLEVMRQPLEDGQVSIARAAQSLTFPARFQLVAAMNPCPCGFLLGGSESFGNSNGGKGDNKPCTCTAPQIRRYLARISGPLVDRIDIHIEVPRLSSEELMSKRAGEPSACVRKRVMAARARQVERMRGDGLTSNGQMKARQLRVYCDMDASTKDLLKAAINQFGLSGRGYDRILKVSRTIADLEASEKIELHHVAEAINYRAFDRKLFG